jgi:hypothetical protein
MYEKSGRRFSIAADNISDDMAATSTDRVVAFFQNKATKNITNIPGVNKPVKFCMN